jgi:hypothetical protein
MSVRYEVRQQVCNVNGCRVEVVADHEFERPARMAFDRWKAEQPTAYFELVEVLHTENCLDFTPMKDA